MLSAVAELRNSLKQSDVYSVIFNVRRIHYQGANIRRMYAPKAEGHRSPPFLCQLLCGLSCICFEYVCAVLSETMLL